MEAIDQEQVISDSNIKDNGIKPIILIISILITAVIFTLIGIGLSYLLYQGSGDNDLHPSISPSPVITVELTDTPEEVDLGSKWSNYDQAGSMSNIWEISEDDPSTFSPVYDSSLKFEISYPSSWSNYTHSPTFEVNDIKVAEIVGVIELREGEECFEGILKEDYTSDMGYSIEFFSQEDITTSKYDGVKRVDSASEGALGSNPYKAVHYCVYIDPSKIFQMFFMLKKDGVENEELYEAVIDSFRFIDQ